MGSPLGFMPDPPKGMTMPPGYELCGEQGMDSRRPVYYWHRPTPGVKWWEDTTAEFGENVSDKRTAVRQAWADYRKRADPAPTNGG